MLLSRARKEEKSSAGLLPSGFTRRSCAGSQSGFPDPGSDLSGQPEGHTRVGYCEVRLAKITPWTAERLSAVLKLLSDILEDLKRHCPSSNLQQEITGPAGNTTKLVPSTLAGYLALRIARIDAAKVINELILCAV